MDLINKFTESTMMLVGFLTLCAHAATCRRRWYTSSAMASPTTAFYTGRQHCIAHRLFTCHVLEGAGVLLTSMSSGPAYCHLHSATRPSSQSWMATHLHYSMTLPSQSCFIVRFLHAESPVVNVRQGSGSMKSVVALKEHYDLVKELFVALVRFVRRHQPLSHWLSL